MMKGLGTLLVFFAIHTAAHCQSTTLEAWVKSYEEDNGTLSFTGFVKNLTTTIEGLSYKMKISKTDHNGQSSNTQSGTFTLEEDGVVALSTVNYNKVDNQVITVDLLIFRRDQEVARATYESDASDLILTDAKAFDAPQQTEKQKASDVILYPTAAAKQPTFKPKEQKAVVEEASKIVSGKSETESKVEVTTKERSTAEAERLPLPFSIKKKIEPNASNPDELEIDGLIIDETRSKTGRDFYGLFYKKWQAPQAAENFSIILKEYPTRGRVARIGVEVNGKLVYQPMLQPRQDLLELTANQAIAIVQKYLLDQKQMKVQMESEDQAGSGLF